jgi:hypothetical protein
LAIALGAFVVAAVAAIFTNVPRSYREADIDGLRKLIAENWDDSESLALEKVAKNRLSVLRRAKEINQDK